ncbi:VOC family protein [Candidatus Viadribacter manganicus]|uniref:Glyoxalase n=1 Tax=Candidatus Viadribacter manganicus TaxID=1759059 RepID=A0A1B1AN02_9PROT|nr:VOC family protein [Candidatus Viadribacter manganicus]ANP47921.1 glyoxalase [Candidatus Viadribacter manganicus]
MEPRVSLITIGVGDLTRSKAFYSKLGFSASSQGGDQVVFMQAGAVALCLFPLESLACDAEVSAEGSGFRGIAIAHNVREKHQVDEVIAEAVAAGGSVAKLGHDASWGGRSGYFSDPDGHLWEVAWNPYFPLSADGALTIPP